MRLCDAPCIDIHQMAAEHVCGQQHLARLALEGPRVEGASVESDLTWGQRFDRLPAYKQVAASADPHPEAGDRRIHAVAKPDDDVLDLSEPISIRVQDLALQDLSERHPAVLLPAERTNLGTVRVAHNAPLSPVVRQPDFDRGSRWTRQRNRAAVSLDDVLGDRQAEPGSRRGGTFRESLEDPRLELRRNTITVVCHRYRCPIAGRREPNRYVTARMGVFERVADKVGQHSAQTNRIPLDG